MEMNEHIAERLLLSKSLLNPIRQPFVSKPNRSLTAKHILIAHDAAELALSAIAQYVGKTPKKQQVHMMDYFPPLSEEHPGEEVYGKEYFSQLNRARVSIKHCGVFPNLQQWFNVGQKTYEYISAWCVKYIKMPLDSMDESALLADPNIKSLYNTAKEEAKSRNYKECLEFIARAEFELFETNATLRGLSVGTPKAEDAIKLSSYGVNANDYLRLQEFLPAASRYSDDPPSISWKQTKFGHPANWRANATDFCLRTFLSLALCIQNAEWTPGAIDFYTIYEYEIMAKIDGAKMWREEQTEEKRIIKKFSKGETIHARMVQTVRKQGLSSLTWLIKPENKPREQQELHIIASEVGYGSIMRRDFEIRCVPRRNEIVKELFPNLPSLEPEEFEEI